MAMGETRREMRQQTDKTGSQPTPAPFGISRRDLDQRTSVISVEGDLDLSTAPQLKWMLVDSLEEGHNQFVVDLSLTGFMDSTALGVLVGVNRSLLGDGRLAIVCTGASLLKIFELSGMDGAFAISATLDEALARAQRPSAEAS
jgi:anti-sigma B factor antagonist